MVPPWPAKPVIAQSLRGAERRGNLIDFSIKLDCFTSFTMTKKPHKAEIEFANDSITQPVLPTPQKNLRGGEFHGLGS